VCLFMDSNTSYFKDLSGVKEYNEICVGRDVKTVLHSTFCLLVSIMFVIICQIRSLIPLKHSAMKV